MSSLKVFNDMLRTNHLAFCSSIYSYGRLQKDGSPDSKKKKTSDTHNIQDIHKQIINREEDALLTFRSLLQIKGFI